MIAIGFGVALAGYAVFMLGYCWARDYNVTPAALFKTAWPGAAAHTGPASAGTGTTQAPGSTTAGGRG